MAVRTRKARPSPAGRAAGVAVGDYQRTRAAIGLGVFAVVFGCLWLVNGLFSVERATAVFAVSYSWGWALHLSISAIELLPLFLAPFMKFIPRQARIVIWLFSLPFGAFDVYANAYEMGPWMQWTGAIGLVANIQNTGLGEALAFLPEPMIFWCLLLLVKTLKG
jgi:hypothetical protein